MWEVCVWDVNGSYDVWRSCSLYRMCQSWGPLPFVIKDLTQTLETSMSPFLNAVIENKQFPLKTTKVSPWLTEAEPPPFVCASSLFRGGAARLFWALLSFLKKEDEQHILSEGTVLCAVWGLHYEQLNHLVREAHTYYSMCVYCWCQNKQCGPPIHDCHSCTCANVHTCVQHSLSCMHAHILANTWPTSIGEKK